MPIFLILLRKIKKMGIHSLFYFAAEGGEYLLRQPPVGTGNPSGLFTQFQIHNLATRSINFHRASVFAQEGNPGLA
jgi:hypothetical protein